MAVAQNDFLHNLSQMALFEAEISKMGMPAEEKQPEETQEKQIDETQDPSAKRARTDEAQEMSETAPKISLVEEAKKGWKLRQKADAVKLEERGKGQWTEHKDPDSGGTYYFNKITQASSWTRPEDFVEPSLEAIQAAIGPKWTVSKDGGSGLLYYFNKETGQSSWDRPADFVKEAAPAAAAAAATGAAALPCNADNGAGDASGVDAEADEVIDLVASTDASESGVPSDKVYARVLAESEDGISIIGFHMLLETPFAQMMEAWANYQELPVESIYFEFEGHVLDPGESPDHYGWTQDKGMLKIEAKPMEEVYETDDELVEADARKKAEAQETVEKWKKQQQKARKKARNAAVS